MHIERVTYESHRVDEVEQFYTDRLGFKSVAPTTGAVAFRVGRTTVEFAPASNGTEPFYHFAFNVPSGVFENAINWLDDRVEIIPTPDGDPYGYFEAMNAYATYFVDPAGNLGEFTARPDLDDPADPPADSFDPSLVRGVGEIGLPVPSVSETISQLREQLSVSPIVEPNGSPSILPVGTKRGMFVVTRVGKEWFMLWDDAEIHPISVRLRGEDARFDPDSLPYEIVRQ